jgi:hypothetical protein
MTQKNTNRAKSRVLIIKTIRRHTMTKQQIIIVIGNAQIPTPSDHTHACTCNTQIP